MDPRMMQKAKEKALDLAEVRHLEQLESENAALRELLGEVLPELEGRLDYLSLKYIQANQALDSPLLFRIEILAAKIRAILGKE